jgi:hypothetical protein
MNFCKRETNTAGTICTANWYICLLVYEIAPGWPHQIRKTKLSEYVCMSSSSANRHAELCLLDIPSMVREKDIYGTIWIVLIVALDV